MTTRLEDLLADPEIVAVAIATPAESHRAVAEACLAAGKHVFVEKPLAANEGDAGAIVQAAEKTGRVLMTGHIFLYDAAVARLVELAQGGAIGNLRYAHVVRTSMAGTARLDTNIVWDALVHDAYILPALFGRPPRRVLAVGQGYLSKLEDVAFVTFDFGNGLLAQVYVSWYALEKVRKITVIGSDAILAYDDLAEAKLVRYARRYEQSAECDPRGRPRWHWWDDGGQVIVARSGDRPQPGSGDRPRSVEPLLAECRHFIECIGAGKPPQTDGRAGLAAVRVLEACQRSLEAGGAWVEV
jgi:UDP-2-acetamido-3-amino-2,3-dideoxy-glucuronate N-acetyltransferase